jgi:hemerythrin superfamily protein
MDAIQLIRKGHQEIERLFARAERAQRDGDLSEQRAVVRAIVRDVSVHVAIEEQLLYPTLQEAGAEERVFEALEEHHLVKLMLAEIDEADPAERRFAPKMRLLSEHLREHMEKEEREILPRVRQALDAAQLRQLGESLARAKAAAPTRPHPAAPDTPPGSLVAGAATAIYDRGRDALRGGIEMLESVAERGLARARGAVDRVERLGQRVAGRAGARGREAAGELRERGRAAIDGASERGREVVERGREAAEGVRRRGRDTARRAQGTARKAASGIRKAGRAATRGYAGEPRTALH